MKCESINYSARNNYNKIKNAWKSYRNLVGVLEYKVVYNIIFLVLF